MEKLNYISTEQFMEGIIIELTDGSVTIDLKGRLGTLKVPLRMLISEVEPKVGQEVGFVMSYPEVLYDEPDPEYVKLIERRNKIKK